MPELNITPKTINTKEHDLKVVISGLDAESYQKVIIEDGTHEMRLFVRSFEDGCLHSPVGESVAEGAVSLPKIESSRHSLISIYAEVIDFIEDKENRTGIYSDFVSIQGESDIDNDLSVSPAFVGPKDRASFNISANPYDRIIASVNDKRFVIIANSDGYGSISFNGKDVIEHEDVSVINKFPIGIYKPDDNYTQEYFSGQFLHVLPSKIAFMANCAEWEMPEECLPDEDPGEENPDVDDNLTVNPIEEGFPDDAVEDCNVIVDENISVCRTDAYSNSKLPNGQMATAIVGHDDLDESTTANQVFVGFNQASSATRVLPVKHGIVPPSNDGQITLFVEKQVWDKINTSWSINLRDKNFNYKTYLISSMSSPDETNGFYRIHLVSNEPNLNNYHFCVEYTARSNEEAEVFLPSGVSQPVSIPYIFNNDGDILSISDVSIAINSYKIDENDVVQVYLIAEAQEENLKQLWFYSFEIRASEANNDNSSWSDQGLQSFGWTKLTESGDNKSPETYVDKYNNLHIFWERDVGYGSQIYYSVLGPSSISFVNASLSSALDKKSELMLENSEAFDWMSEPLIEKIESSKESTLRNFSCGLSNNSHWVRYQENDGEVTVRNNSEIDIAGRGDQDQAIAFAQLYQDDEENEFDGNFSQLNFSIELNLIDNEDSDIFDYEEMNNEFKNWLQNFIPDRRNENDNTVIYYYKNNRFLVEETGPFYDKFVPILGSYKNPEISNYLENCRELVNDEEFMANISGEDRNLNHFMLGIMPEKVRFAANNIESFDEFCDRMGLPESICQNQYTLEHEQIIFTGYYKLFVIMTNNGDYFGSIEQKPFSIHREVGKRFTLDEINRLQCICNYNKMNNQEIDSWFGNVLEEENNSSKYLFRLTILLDDNLEFSSSIPVDLTDQYRSFEIGIGFPGHGQYFSDIDVDYGSMIYDEKFVDITFSDIVVGKPQVQFNKDIIYLSNRHFSDQMVVDDDLNETQSYDFSDRYNILDLGLSDEQMEFSFLPITFEGLNYSPSVDGNIFSTDVHLTWQSNRFRYWDVFYTSNIGKHIPFRQEYQISRTKSNSVSPDISLKETGARVITWHDDRERNYKIYMARSIDDKGLNFLPSSVSYNSCIDSAKEIVSNKVNNFNFNNKYNNDTLVSFNYHIISEDPYDPYQDDDDFNCVHFRILFYSDSNRESLVYSAFSLLDQRRWMFKKSSENVFHPITTEGVLLEGEESVEVKYDPEVVSIEFMDNQFNTSLNENIFEKPLLCGMTYYLEIEIYNGEEFELFGTDKFQASCQDVESYKWPFEVEDYWISSGFGDTDLKVTESINHSLFSSVDFNHRELAMIAWQDFRRSNRDTRSLNYHPEVFFALYDLHNDLLYSSGQSFVDHLALDFGFQPVVANDHNDRFFISGSIKDNVMMWKCTLPVEETIEGDSTSQTPCQITDHRVIDIDDANIDSEQYLKARVYDDDVYDSYVIDKNNIVPIVKDYIINLEVTGLPSAYAVRLRNEDDDNWSGWINIDREIRDQSNRLSFPESEGGEDNATLSAYSIDSLRFVTPWVLSCESGLKSVSLQVLTPHGISPVFNTDIMADIADISYNVELSSSDDVEFEKFKGFPVVTTHGEDLATINVNVIFDDPERIDFLLNRLKNWNKLSHLSNNITFSVIQSGYDDTSDHILTNQGNGLFTGQFVLHKSDGIMNQDGQAVIYVNTPSPCLSDNRRCAADDIDNYNRSNPRLIELLTDNSLNSIQDLDPNNLNNRLKDKGKSRIINKNNGNSLYNSDDPRFSFGNPDYFLGN